MQSLKNVSLQWAAVALLAWTGAAPLEACFQEDCRQPIPAPPQQQRLPLPAQVLDADALAWGIHWGVNDRSSIAGQNEGSTYFRLALGNSGIETDYGFGAPMFIPYMDIRAQLLGYGWEQGPYLTLEVGGDMLPTRHIGLALGGKFGPFSPFVAGSVGHSLDKDYIEANAGLVMELREQLSLNLSVSRRWHYLEDDDILANTASVALDWHLLPSKSRRETNPSSSRRRRGRRDRDRDPDAVLDEDDAKAWPQPPAKTDAKIENSAAPAAAADAAANPEAKSAAGIPSAGADPCAFSATIDAFDPARWEARARCLDALGKPDDARAARAKAKELRAADKAKDSDKDQ